MFQLPNFREDIRVLPSMFRTRRLLWLPFVLVIVGFVLALVIYGIPADLQQWVALYLQFFFVPQALFTYFIAGLPGAARVVPGRLDPGRADAASCGASCSSPTRSPARTCVNTQTRLLSDVSARSSSRRSSWARSPAGFAAWYRDFLRDMQKRGNKRRAEKEAQAARQAARLSGRKRAASAKQQP